MPSRAAIAVGALTFVLAACGGGTKTTSSTTVSSSSSSSSYSFSSSPFSSSSSSSTSGPLRSCALVTADEASGILGRTVVTEQRRVGDYDYCYYEPGKDQASIASVAIVDPKGASPDDAYSSVASAQSANDSVAGVGDKAACAESQTPIDLVVEAKGRVLAVAAESCGVAQRFAELALTRL